MALRRKRARPETSLDESQHSSLDDWPGWVVDFRPNPEQVCAAMEAKEAIEKHVDQLSAGVRSAFRLRAVEGLSTERGERSTWGFGKRREVAIATSTDPIGGGAARTASEASS